MTKYSQQYFILQFHHRSVIRTGKNATLNASCERGAVNHSESLATLIYLYNMKIPPRETVENI